MTPTALVALVARALNRPGTQPELLDWARVLERVPDDIADQALLDHRATSTYPPTLADIRRLATLALNDRAMRAEAEQRRLERETGQTADGQPLVPMPAEVRNLTDQLAARQRARAAALEPDPERLGAGPETGHAPRTWPCCAHCTGTADQVGHPPHRLPCDLCTAPALDASTHEGASA